MAFDHSTIAGLTSVLPDGLAPTTEEAVKALAKSWFVSELADDDAVADYVKLIEDKIAALEPLQQAKALGFADSPAGRNNRIKHLRIHCNKVTASDYNGWDKDQRIQRLRWVGSSSQQDHTIPPAYKRLYGLYFTDDGVASDDPPNNGGQEDDVDELDGDGDFVVPETSETLAADLRSCLGQSVTAKRSELAHFIAMVAPDIVPDVSSLSDANLVRCAHRCLNVLPRDELRSKVAGSPDWRAAFARIPSDELQQVAFAPPGSTLEECFGSISDTFEGCQTVADALGIARASGPALVTAIGKHLGNWTMSTINEVRLAAGSAVDKVSAAPGANDTDALGAITAPANLVALAVDRAGLQAHDAERAHAVGLSAEALLQARSIHELTPYVSSLGLPLLSALFNAASKARDEQADSAGTSLSASGTVRSSLLLAEAGNAPERICALAAQGISGLNFVRAAVEVVAPNNAATLLLSAEVPSSGKYHHWRTAHSLLEAAIGESLRAHDQFAIGAVPSFSAAALKALRCGALCKLVADSSWSEVFRSAGASVSKDAPFDLERAAASNAATDVFDGPFRALHGSSLRLEVLDRLGGLAAAGLPSAAVAPFALKILMDFESRLRAVRNSAPLLGDFAWPSLKPSESLRFDIEQTRRTAHISKCILGSGGSSGGGGNNNKRRAPGAPSPGPQLKNQRRNDSNDIARTRFPVKSPPGFVPGKTTFAQYREIKSRWLDDHQGCFNMVHCGICFDKNRGRCNRCK